MPRKLFNGCETRLKVGGAEMKRYVFFIVDTDGSELRWRNLTEKQARSLHKWTEEHIDWSNINSFGWEEME